MQSVPSLQHVFFQRPQASGLGCCPKMAGEEAERVQAEECLCTQSSTIFGFSDLFISKWPFGGAEVADTWGLVLLAW